MSTRNSTVPIEHVEVSAYTIPTDRPEADGTYAWQATTLVLVQATAGDVRGLGYTYADTATARLIHDHLAGIVEERDAFDVPGAWDAMVRSIRNLGRPGISSMAVSAVDAALWDVKARLLDLPLCKLLGQARESVPVYGSGGFTTYSLSELEEQLGGWAAQVHGAAVKPDAQRRARREVVDAPAGRHRDVAAVVPDRPRSDGIGERRAGDDQARTEREQRQDCS